MKRICKKCGKKFIPSIWNQVYCGSKTKKTGCSWWNASQRRSRERWAKNKKYRKYQKEYQKEWKKEQRRLNTDYAKRQRELKRKYGQSIWGKKMAARWRKRNIKKILEWNRQRLLQKRGIIGFHSQEEWKELKDKYNHCCAECGISEKELGRIWPGTSFTELTKDHIIPSSKEGTDFINNIQPLCVSCNARKHSQILKKNKEVVVAVSGYFNPIHIGHIRLFEAAKKLGTKLIVIVNSDEQVKLKGSIPFMNERERIEIITALAMVDNVILSIDKDRTVRRTLKLIKPDIFANGGDRNPKKDPVPEVKTCKKIGCKMAYNVGKGGKIQSSSWLAENAARHLKDKKEK